jgi:hypothetical protein
VPAIAAAIHPSFDHLIGGCEQPIRHGEVERFGGLEVDDQFELDRILNRQVCRLLVAQYVN